MMDEMNCTFNIEGGEGWMMDTVYYCNLCGLETTDKEDIKHLPLYVMGTEGVYVCLKCRMVLTAVAGGIMSACTAARMTAYKTRKPPSPQQRRRRIPNDNI